MILARLLISVFPIILNELFDIFNVLRVNNQVFSHTYFHVDLLSSFQYPLYKPCIKAVRVSLAPCFILWVFGHKRLCFVLCSFVFKTWSLYVTALQLSTSSPQPSSARIMNVYHQAWVHCSFNDGSEVFVCFSVFFISCCLWSHLQPGMF